MVMTTILSKALGSRGGAVLGSAAVRDHPIDAARPFTFDTGLAPAAVGAAQATLHVLSVQPWRLEAVAAERIAPDVDMLLQPMAQRLPLGCPARCRTA